MPELKLIASVEVTGRYTGNGNWYEARDRAGTQHIHCYKA